MELASVVIESKEFLETPHDQKKSIKGTWNHDWLTSRFAQDGKDKRCAWGCWNHSCCGLKDF